jgi:DNA-binding NtrC family response regulator
MRRLEEEISWASGFDVNIMISGEKGVGKKAVAFRLHRQSRRSPRQFHVLRSEGALDSAENLTSSLLEAGQDGTVLLEQPQWMSLPLQSRLLKFIERGTHDRQQSSSRPGRGRSVL